MHTGTTRGAPSPPWSTNGRPHPPTNPAQPAQPAQPTEIVVGDLRIDLRRSRASLEGRTLPLRSREFELLAFLASRHGEFVPRMEIRRAVWGDASPRKNNTLCVHLTSLRVKLGERAAAPRLLHSRRSVGVMLGPRPDSDRRGSPADHRAAEERQLHPN